MYEYNEVLFEPNLFLSFIRLLTLPKAPFLDCVLASGTIGDLLSTYIVLDLSGSASLLGVITSADRGVRTAVCCKPLRDSIRGDGGCLRGISGTRYNIQNKLWIDCNISLIACNIK